jgi:hypothetical protein
MLYYYIVKYILLDLLGNVITDLLPYFTNSAIASTLALIDLPLRERVHGLGLVHNYHSIEYRIPKSRWSIYVLRRIAPYTEMDLLYSLYLRRQLGRLNNIHYLLMFLRISSKLATGVISHL